MWEMRHHMGNGLGIRARPTIGGLTSFCAETVDLTFVLSVAAEGGIMTTTWVIWGSKLRMSLLILCFG